MKESKAKMAKELTEFLMVKDVDWQRLRKKDLAALHEAFMKLKRDVDDVFRLLDEAPSSAESPQKTMEKLIQYVI